MPVKCCEICGTQFHARLSSIRTCGVECRNRLISAERQAKHRATKTCAVCGKEFEVGANDKKRQTCSRECGYKLRGSKTSTSVQMQCATCNTGFFTQLSQANAGGGRYCSKQCQYDRNKADTLRKCECCGKEFTSPPSQMHVKTCSTECGYKVREVWNEKEKVEVTCKHCSKKFLEHESKASDRVYCSRECMFDDGKRRIEQANRVSGAGNPNWKGGLGVAAVSASGRKYTRQLPHIETEKIARRKRVKEQATPDWADIDKVCEIYRLARQISETTGVPHHVDHIVPLKSDMVCGFHNEFNLRVVPGIENLQKGNRHWPDMW